MGIVTKLQGITKHIMLSVVLGALQGRGGVQVVCNLEFGAKGEPVRHLCRFRTHTHPFIGTKRRLSGFRGSCMGFCGFGC